MVAGRGAVRLACTGLGGTVVPWFGSRHGPGKSRSDEIGALLPREGLVHAWCCLPSPACPHIHCSMPEVFQDEKRVVILAILEIVYWMILSGTERYGTVRNDTGRHRRFFSASAARHTFAATPPRRRHGRRRATEVRELYAAFPPGIFSSPGHPSTASCLTSTPHLPPFPDLRAPWATPTPLRRTSTHADAHHQPPATANDH